ncbi:MAG TPA: hypothetical protein VH500_19560 [Nitrososphaeraceae archaeon]|jgi:glycosyltransferase involved in cell wall biosynthesis
MKILHLSDSSLPDWRIEKSALSSKKMDDSIYFGGPRNSSYNSIFDKIYDISWTSRSRNRLPFHWNSVKKQMLNTIRELRPDIIHAHNIFSAAMVTEIGDYPLVYDDHEYWSMYAKIKLEAYSDYWSNKKGGLSNIKNSGKKFVLDLVHKRFAKIWSKSEKDIVMNNPTITVSKPIIDEFIKFSKKIYLVPNFPGTTETENIPEPKYHDTLSSVYAGNQMRGPIKPKHVDLEGFFNLFEQNNIGKLSVLGWDGDSTSNVIFQGHLNRIQMYSEMQKNSVGLIPFKKHWFHPFSSPNKAYEYAHAGLLVMNTSDLISITANLREHCIQFENYEDLTRKLCDLSNDLEELYSKRLNLYRFARNNLLWEKFEKNIFESYKAC